mmetsp:Transcript_21513/g.32011  ORF Transcript_21513/g.32011 Transcript_21513/m.32011 type:complete len:577 (+) Transcript_21513:68-1798(+)
MEDLSIGTEGRRAGSQAEPHTFGVVQLNDDKENKEGLHFPRSTEDKSLVDHNFFSQQSPQSTFRAFGAEPSIGAFQNNNPALQLLENMGNDSSHSLLNGSGQNLVINGSVPSAHPSLQQDLSHVQVGIPTQSSLPISETNSSVMRVAPQVGTVKDVLSSLKKYQEGKTKITKLSRRKKRGPQPPLSAVTYFRYDVLSQICKEHPSASAEEIILMVENRWQLLEDDKRSVYLDKAQKDQERYSQELKLYLPKSQGGKMKKTKTKKHPKAPKHPKSAYLFFVGENRSRVKSENPNLGFTEIARKLGEEWRKLDEKTAQKYQNMAIDDKERYRREKEQFQPPPADLDEEKQQQLNAKRKRKHPLAPKHPLSSYLFFVATNRQKINEKYPNKDFTEVARILGTQWRNLDPSERRIFEILAYADKKRYLEEKDKWIPPQQTQDLKRRKRSNDMDEFVFAEWYDDTVQLGGLDPSLMWMNMQEQGIQQEAFVNSGSSSLAYRSQKLNKYDSSKEVPKWSPMDVGRFIISIGLQNFQNSFIQNEIDGKQFLRLSQTDLEKRIGVDGEADREKILKAIANLQGT